MELIDKQALREKLKDKICIFPAVIRRAIDEAPVVHEVTNRDREALQEHIMSLIPETIDTDAGTHIYLLYQERMEIAKAVAAGLTIRENTINALIDKMKASNIPLSIVEKIEQMAMEVIDDE